MPDVRNKETVDLIAEYYCTNGHNKTKALIDTGYADEYADSGAGHKVFENVRVKKAIAERMAKLQAKIEYSYDIAISQLDTVIKNLTSKAKGGSIQANQALVAAIREKNAITGLHKQTINTKDETVLQPTDLEKQAHRAGADIANRIIARGGLPEDIRWN